MQLHKRDVVDAATAILDSFGIADLTMRRLARELNVSPGALYWHFANKQQLLGAVADRILQPALHAGPTETWREQVRGDCHRLRDALLDEEAIEVQLHAWGGRLWARASAQIYNEISDFELGGLADGVFTTVASDRMCVISAMRASTMPCSFLASSYSEFSEMSPNSRATRIRSATSRRRSVESVAISSLSRL